MCHLLIDGVQRYNALFPSPSGDVLRQASLESTKIENMFPSPRGDVLCHMCMTF